MFVTKPGALLEASKPQKNFLSLPATAYVHMAMPGLLHGCWGFELRSLCSHSKHSYPLSPLSSLVLIFLAYGTVRNLAKCCALP